jgi:RND superfamily putative drug exporter
VTESLARAAARHPRRTIGAWSAVIVAALAAVALLLPGSLTSDATVTNHPESQRANELRFSRFPRQHLVDELVVLRSPRWTVDQPAFRAQARRLVAAIVATGAVADASPSSVSADRHAQLVAIEMGADPDSGIDRVVDVVQRENERAHFEAAITGNFTTDRDFNRLSQHDLEHGELAFGLPAAIVVLVFVFGALVGAAVPLLLAIVAIVVGLGLTAVVGQFTDLSIYVINMLVGMGLALGIDYSLFIVSRFREERSAGRQRLDAIALAGATASRAVLFSGSAFVLAMVGMVLVQSTVLRSLAIGAILVGIVSVAAALTLLPALLALLGDRVNSLTVPVIGKRITRSAGTEGRLFSRVVRGVMARPAVSLVAVLALLLAVASPVLGLRTGASGVGLLPDRLVSKQGYEALRRSFPAAGAEPAAIVVDGAVRTAPVRGAVERLRAQIRRDRAFGTQTWRVNPDGTLGLLEVQVAGDSVGDPALEAVQRLRHSYIPTAFAGVDARALVAGNTAENLDYFAVIDHWLPIVIVFVLGLSFLLLTVAFRSIVVAATAIVLNLLSVGAAYGLLVLVFQHGVGAGLLGFERSPRIEAWVPLFLFSVLFGLSMDYQVFLLSRIRERYTQTGDTDAAIAYGVGSTARLITGAALIIIVVFIGFAAGDLVMFQQMGFGIAVALLIDATLIRTVVVPAAMKLLGAWNWYLPRWLDWLPHVEVEGAPDAPVGRALG